MILGTRGAFSLLALATELPGVLGRPNAIASTGDVFVLSSFPRGPDAFRLHPGRTRKYVSQTLDINDNNVRTHVQYTYRALGVPN